MSQEHYGVIYCDIKKDPYYRVFPVIKVLPFQFQAGYNTVMTPGIHRSAGYSLLYGDIITVSCGGVNRMGVKIM